MNSKKRVFCCQFLGERNGRQLFSLLKSLQVSPVRGRSGRMIFHGGIFILFILLLVTALSALAWTPPSAAPPGDNVPKPMNVGPTAQYKSGKLGVGTASAVQGVELDVYGEISGTSNIYGAKFFDYSNNSYYLDPANAGTSLNTAGVISVSGSGNNYFAGKIGIGTASPSASALLDLYSTTGSLLVPRMTTTQRDALAATNGMFIYNTTTGGFEGYTTSWGEIGGGGGVEWRQEFTATANQTVFDITVGTYTTGNDEILVFYNGVLQQTGSGNDYVETDLNTITFNNPRAVGKRIVIIKGSVTEGGGEDGWIDAGDVVSLTTAANTVGIGTATPQEKLDLRGRLYIGDMTAPDPTTNRLYSVSGNLYWDGTVVTTGSGGFWTQSGSDIYYTTGNVGIGTTGPQVELDVVGDIQARGTGNVYGTKFWDYSNNSYYLDPANTGTALNVAGIITVSGSGNNYFAGNVGIGTTGPLYPFHVEKDQNSVTFSAVKNPGTGTGAYAALRSEANAGNIDVRALGSGYTTSGRMIADSGLIESYNLAGGLSISAFEAVPIMFWTNQAERMRITGNGNVGIGTTSPQDDLHVWGNITVNGINDCSGSDAVVRTDGTKRLVCGSITGAGGVTGTGTQNYLPKWNSAGTGLVDSNIVYESGGNVGIGTTGPGAKLSFAAGTTAADGIDFGGDVTLYRSAADTLKTDDNLIVGGSSGINVHYGGYMRDLRVGFDSNTVEATGGGDLTLKGGDVLLNPTSGNVGIGTTSPDNILHIAKDDGGGHAGAPIAIIENTGTATGFNHRAELDFKAKKGSDQTVKTSYIFHEADGEFSFNAGGSGYIVFRAGGERMRIENGGNVGIGVTSPSTNLEVDGTGAREIRIDSSDQTGDATLTLSTDRTFSIASKNAGNELIIRDVSNAVDVLTIEGDGTGNVGIGTTSPSDKLEVIGDVAVYGSATDNEGMRLETYYSDGNTGSRVFYIHAENNNYGFSTIYSGIGNPTFGGTAFTLPANKFYIIRHDNSATGDVAMTIERTTGRVGIGVTSPGAKLHVNSGSIGNYISGSQFTGDISGGNYGSSQLRLTTSGADGTPVRLDFVDDASGTILANIESAHYGTGQGGYLAFGTRPSPEAAIVERMRMDNSGNVGIGATSPDGLLQVGEDGVTSGAVYIEAANYASLLFRRAGTTDYVIQTRADITRPNLVFRLSDTTNVMTLDNSGNVGIGVTSPKLKTYISGGTDASESGSATPNGAFGLRAGATSIALTMGGFSGTPRHMWIQARDDAAATFYPIVLNPSGGNVGIGITSPGAKLDVSTPDGESNSSKTLQVQQYNDAWDSTGTTPRTIASFTNRTNAGRNIEFQINYDSSRGSDALLFREDRSSYNFLEVHNGKVILAPDSGNVGIGVGSPSEKLEVSGNIEATGYVCGNRFMSWFYSTYSGMANGNDAATTYTNLDSEGKTYTCLDCNGAQNGDPLDCTANNGAWMYCEFKVTC